MIHLHFFSSQCYVECLTPERKRNAKCRLWWMMGSEGEFNESATSKINAVKAKHPSGISVAHSQKC